MDDTVSDKRERAIEVELDGTFFSADSILKTCYWFSRHFTFELKQGDGRTIVMLQPKDTTLPTSAVHDDFLAMATDFSLRERIEARTANIREILLAKAFAESGILEDSPAAIFLDQFEQEKPGGLFKILSDP